MVRKAHDHVRDNKGLFMFQLNPVKAKLACLPKRLAISFRPIHLATGLNSYNRDAL